MIPTEVITRFEQLQAMATVAVATADGLRPAVLHWQGESQRQASAFESAARDYGRVEIRDGQPVRLLTRENRVGNRIAWTAVAEPVPELFGHATELLRSREKLAAARERLDEANHRAAGLRSAVDSAREALRDRGWREAR